MMKVLLLIFLVFTTTLFRGQDTVSFNETLSKNSVSATIAGDTYLYGIGYQRCIKNNISYRILLDVKTSYSDAIFYLPVSLYCEFFEKRNKLLVGFAIGNSINPNYRYTSLNDVKELKKTNLPLYISTPFVYVPYLSVKLGYKRYFRKNHAFSIEGMVISYPKFRIVEDNPNISRLSAKFVPFGAISYYYQF